MRLLLSPAKTFRKEALPVEAGASQPMFASLAKELMAQLSTLSVDALMDTMEISAPLAEETAQRHLNWGGPFHPGNARTAIHAFHGEVFRALGADRWNASDLDHAQDKLRIISGLYGLLRPLDLIQDYRLEMGGRWSPENADSLYAYWGETLSDQLLKEGKEGTWVNLASQEYFKAVDHPALAPHIVQVHFKEERNGEYKMVGTYAKTARGRMARFIIKERIHSIEGIQAFCEDGYRFNPSLSTTGQFVFTRPTQSPS